MPSYSVPIDTRDLTITPFFKIVHLENIPKSERAGHAVYETQEVVEVRFAGTNNYAPVFPSHAVWRRQGNKSITYAERWSEQYLAFKEGNSQEASGTPLEMLKPYGITPELLSRCRVHRIYSIEALDALEDKALKSLGMVGNTLKDMVRRYNAANMSHHAAQNEIEALKARIAELESRSTVVPVKEDELYEAMSEDELRKIIFEKTGERVDGRLKHNALVNLVKGL